MTENTTVNVQLDYNYNGTLHSLNYEIKGDGTSNDDETYIIGEPNQNPYGQNEYGIIPYGSDSKVEDTSQLASVMVFKKLPLRYSPYDYTVQFSADGLGQRAKILSYGFFAHMREELPKRSIAKNS